MLGIKKSVQILNPESFAEEVYRTDNFIDRLDNISFFLSYYLLITPSFVDKFRDSALVNGMIYTDY